jgi:hypothetical protein
MPMLQDLERGKSVEIDALLTVIHDIGLLVGVPTPSIDGVLGLARLRANSLGLHGNEPSKGVQSAFRLPQHPIKIRAEAPAARRWQEEATAR